jgi:hypothetical protein
MAIEFTAMEIFHHALRRDLTALTTEFDHPTWRNFAFQLHFHHTSEDRLLWPLVQEKVTDVDDGALLVELEAEHALIDPLLGTVEDVLATGGNVTAPLAELAEALYAHLEHEEQEGLPLIDSVLTPAEWEAYVGAVRSQDGDMAQNPAVFLPWLLKDAPEELRGRMLAGIPEPVRAMFA